MSIQYGYLASVIIKQYFGENVQLVADALFSSTSRTLPVLIKCTKLSRSEISLALAILIKFQLVNFSPSPLNETIPEYSLKKDSILLFLRYPRYMQLMQAKYGEVSALIVEEILRSGAQIGSILVLKCFTNIENKDKLITYRDAFINMIQANYLKRLPTPKPKQSESETFPTLFIEPYELFTPPTIDLDELLKIQSGELLETKDSNIFWQVNFERFHQDFRDSLLIGAVERKLGQSAGDCFKFILQQMYERTDPWEQNCSNPITYAELKQTVEKKSNNIDLIKYLDQYINLVAEDSLGFIKKIGGTGGGQYIVDLKSALEELTICCAENIITEKFGTKASRIFRVIKFKKFIEQEDIQKEAMVPAKEAKLLTYKLFEEQFIQIKTIRKAGGGGAGPAKSFFLFYVNDRQVVKMLLDICYKSLFNAITRSSHEKRENKRLIDKSQKLDGIVEAMKERGESDEYIAEILETLTPPEREILEKVKFRIKTLSASELALDETIFLLQLYQYYFTENIIKI